MQVWTKILLAVAGLTFYKVAIAVGLPLSGLHHNRTDSLPRGIYRETNEPLTYGVLAAECLPSPWAELGVRREWLGKGSCPNGTMAVLKKIVALPGDTVDIRDSHITVNGTVIPNSASLFLDSQGREIPRVVRGTYVLTAQQYLLLGTSETSWDGRYTGPAESTDIISTQRPVWIEEGE